MTKASRTAIYAAGVMNVLVVALHVSLWWVLGWREELAGLSVPTREFVLVANLALMALFAIAVYLSFAHPTDLVDTPLGRALLTCFTLFWALRAGAEVYFTTLRDGEAIVFTGFFLLIAALYAFPLTTRLHRPGKQPA